MNIYDSTLDYISNLPVLKEWPETIALLERAAIKQPRDWRLPVLTCQAVGGGTEQALPASASVACALIGILLIDDMLDDDPRGEFQRVGQAQAANFASVLLTASSQAVLQSQAEPAIKLPVLESLTQMILSVGYGQHLDVQNPADEDAYWHMVQMKSGSFFRTTWELGALFGGASIETVRAIGDLGGIYGEMIQIHDDMNDCLAAPAAPDWSQGRFPLPILFAQMVDHPQRDRFLELRQRITAAEALCEAQDILIKSGAISYCVDQLLRRYRDAQAIATKLELVHPDKLGVILEEVIAPLWSLFDMSENQQSELLTSTRWMWEKTE